MGNDHVLIQYTVNVFKLIKTPSKYVAVIIETLQLFLLLCNYRMRGRVIIHPVCVSACAGVGGGAGGVPLEVWCRYYYPNVRDQVIAKVSV